MDIPAVQHLLSLFPQLTLRQRRVAQQELTAPHAITSLNTQLPACRGCPHCHADSAPLAPRGWRRGLRLSRFKLCLRTSSVLTTTPLSLFRTSHCSAAYAQA
ncbi:IS1595 family transposase, partial [Aeromonas jandaei]